MKKELWEVLVPTLFEDTKRPVSVRHHRKWDEQIRGIAGGLTILKPAKGQWVHQDKLYEDRVIPVRIACTRPQILQICEITRKHYRQIAVMAYKLSEEVIVYNGFEPNIVCKGLRKLDEDRFTYLIDCIRSGAIMGPDEIMETLTYAVSTWMFDSGAGDGTRELKEVSDEVRAALPPDVAEASIDRFMDGDHDT